MIFSENRHPLSPVHALEISAEYQPRLMALEINQIEW